MDEYGYQDLNMDYMDYLERIARDEDEAAIAPHLYGDVPVLETQSEQLPWSGGASSSFGSSDNNISHYNNYSNNNDVSYDYAYDYQHMDMQNEYFPPDNTPLQHIPFDAPPPAASPPQLTPLPPFLENPPRTSTAPVASSPESGGIFSMVFPSVQVDNTSRVFSGGSETAEIAAPAALPVKVAGETVNMPAGASTSTDKATLLTVDGDRKRKGREIVEVDDDPEIQESANTKRHVEPTKPKRTRSREMHNLAEMRRRHRSNDKLNTIFGFVPDCMKGRGNKDDMMDKVICFMRSIIHGINFFMKRNQYLEAEMRAQLPRYGMMYPYTYMPPAMANPPPPAAGLSLGPTFPSPMYPPAAAGLSMGPIFPVPMYQPAAAAGATFPVPMYQAPPVPLSLADQLASVSHIPGGVSPEEYQHVQAFRQMQQMALAQTQNEQPGGSNRGSQEAGNPGNNQSGNFPNSQCWY